jgi:hypothetical protein
MRADAIREISTFLHIPCLDRYALWQIVRDCVELHSSPCDTIASVTKQSFYFHIRVVLCLRVQTVRIASLAGGAFLSVAELISR